MVPGDGIGKEVIPAGQRVLEALAAAESSFQFEFENFAWGGGYYRQHGEMMPANGLDALRAKDAILFGSAGDPHIPDHITLWGLRLKICQGRDQYANVRPARLLPGIQSPLAGVGPEDLDWVIVRENSEGEYSAVGGRFGEGTENEIVFQESIFTRRGGDRILAYAYEYARSRPKKHLTSATKSNGITITMPYWDERVKAMAEKYPDIRTDQYHIDILTANFVLHPDWFDVVVGSNLFGDILSDLGPAVVGTIGIAPSANLNPEREYPSMFEPVHGSAPDIAGKGIANPIAQIWSGAMMLDHLGYPEAGAAIVTAIETVLTKGPRTRDIGGTANTVDVGKAIAEAVMTN